MKSSPPFRVASGSGVPDCWVSGVHFGVYVRGVRSGAVGLHLIIVGLTILCQPDKCVGTAQPELFFSFIDRILSA